MSKKPYFCRLFKKKKKKEKGKGSSGNPGGRSEILKKIELYLNSNMMGCYACITTIYSMVNFVLFQNEPVSIYHPLGVAGPIIKGAGSSPLLLLSIFSSTHLDEIRVSYLIFKGKIILTSIIIMIKSISFEKYFLNFVKRKRYSPQI